jgi:hypothetical protein
MIADLGADAVEHQDTPRAQRRADPVRDDDQRAGPAREGGFGARLGGGVKVAAGFVEDGDRRGRQ